MQVVGHQLQGHDGNLRVVARYAPPLLLNAETQLGEPDTWCIGIADRRVAAPHHLAKERAAAFSGHRNHIDLTPSIVVTYATALHGRFFLSCKCLLLLKGFLLHCQRHLFFDGVFLYFSSVVFPLFRLLRPRRNIQDKRDSILNMVQK